MSDATATDKPPVIAPSDYSMPIGLKNCAWFTGIVASVHAAMPKVIEGVSAIYGVPPTPDSPFSKALPYVIAAGLFLIHDWQKIKSRFKWI